MQKIIDERTALNQPTPADYLTKMRIRDKEASVNTNNRECLYLVTDVTSFEKGDRVLSPNPLVDKDTGGIVLSKSVIYIPTGWCVYRCHTWGEMFEIDNESVRVGRCVIAEKIDDTLSVGLRQLPNMTPIVRETYRLHSKTRVAALAALAISPSCLIHYVLHPEGKINSDDIYEISKIVLWSSLSAKAKMNLLKRIYERNV